MAKKSQPIYAVETKPSSTYEDIIGNEKILITTLYRWFDLKAAPDQLATLNRCQIPQLEQLVAQKYARPEPDGDSTPAAPVDYTQLARNLRSGLAQRSAGRAKPFAPLPPLYTEFNRAAEAANKENRCP